MKQHKTMSPLSTPQSIHQPSHDDAMVSAFEKLLELLECSDFDLKKTLDQLDAMAKQTPKMELADFLNRQKIPLHTLFNGPHELRLMPYLVALYGTHHSDSPLFNPFSRPIPLPKPPPGFSFQDLQSLFIKLQSMGVNINAKAESSMDALTIAVWCFEVPLVTFLLDLGAELHWDGQDRSPLYVAVRYWHYEMAELLLKRGALSHAHKEPPYDDLDYLGLQLTVGQACMDLPMLKLLFEYGADLIESMSRATKLSLLTLVINDDLGHFRRENQLATVHWLLERGASPDFAHPKGLSPLHEAAQRGLLSISEALILHGGSIHLKTPKGMTALHYAAGDSGRYFHQPELVCWLVRQGADVTALTLDGESAYDIAIKAEHHETADYLKSCETALHEQRVLEGILRKNTHRPSSSLSKAL